MCITKIPIHIRCFIVHVLNILLLDRVFIYLFKKGVYSSLSTKLFSRVCVVPPFDIHQLIIENFVSLLGIEVDISKVNLT